MAVEADFAGITGENRIDARRIREQPRERWRTADLHGRAHLRKNRRVADGLNRVAVALFGPQEKCLPGEVAALPKRRGIIQLRRGAAAQLPAPLVVVPRLGEFALQGTHPEPAPMRLGVLGVGFDGPAVSRKRIVELARVL